MNCEQNGLTRVGCATREMRYAGRGNTGQQERLRALSLSTVARGLSHYNNSPRKSKQKVRVNTKWIVMKIFPLTGGIVSPIPN